MAGRFQVRQLRGDDDPGDARDVQVTANGDATVGGAGPFSVAPVDAHAVDVSVNGQRRRVFVAGPPDAREVFVDGQVFRFDVTAAGERRTRATAAHGDVVMAPMPGTIIKVMVEPGQLVQRGAILVKLEAMKMELPLRAPRDATVKAVHGRPGELVQSGATLVELESSVVGSR